MLDCELRPGVGLGPFQIGYHGLSSPRMHLLTRQCHRRLPLDRPLQPARTKAYLPERTSKI